MKRFIPFLVFAGIITGLIGCQKADTSKYPNLIVIMTDDQGYADVGFNGCKDIPTPNIDKIATQGVRFTDGYVTFPVCSPSRAGFITGRYQDRFGYTTNPTIDPGNPIAGLPLEEETMADILKKANYKSAIIGKWHLGTHPKLQPLERGFDYFYGFLSGGHDYFPESLTLNDLSEGKRKWAWYGTKIIENRTTVETDEYLTDELSHAAVQFIEKQVEADQRFMVYLAYNAPHTPLQATGKYLSRFSHIKDEKRKTYAAMVSAIDDGVGRVLQTLEDGGIEENTIVVFLSDNGGPTNTNASRNDPLRSGKGHLYEGGIRVPFAMQWKGVLPAGQTYEKPVSSLDILATIAGQTDVKINPDKPLDGVNLVPYLTGEKKGEPHDYLFWRKWEQNGMAIRHGKTKVVADRNQEENPPELYDLHSNVREAGELKSTIGTSYDHLLSKWQEWDEQMRDREFPTLGADEWWE